MTSVDTILEDLKRRGATAKVTPLGKLRIEPGTALDATLLADLKAQRDAIIAELRRRESITLAEREHVVAEGRRADLAAPGPRSLRTMARRGVICQECRRLGLGYGIDRGPYVCPECDEWRVLGCAAFTVLKTCDAADEAQCGACLACGASWALHGRPEAGTWRRVTDLDDVCLVAVRYVLAAAKAIARGSSE